MLSAFVYATLSHAGVPALRRRTSRAAVVLCYHNVVTGAPAGGDPGLHLPLREFEWQVGLVAARYDVVPLDLLVDRIRAHRSVKGLAAITFDDAYHGALAHAWPVLHGAGLPATLFVPSRAIDRGTPFWWDQSPAAGTMQDMRDVWIDGLQGDAALIGPALDQTRAAWLPMDRRPAEWSAICRAHAEGLALGMHSVTHRNLRTLDDRELCREVAENRWALADRCGADASMFSYPYGLHDARVRAAVRRAGAAGAVTLDFGRNDAWADPWALRRVNVPASIPRAAFESWAAGLRMPRVA